jgi:hypothetical protein
VLLVPARAVAQEPATLQVVCSVEGAKVFVDGNEAATLPLEAPIEVTPGEHLVMVVAEGHVPAARMITFEPGQHRSLKARLVPVPEDPCMGVGCSGHGQCRAVQGNARCECEVGFEPSLTWLECRPTPHAKDRTRSTAVLGIVFTAMGLVLGALAPTMLAIGEEGGTIAFGVSGFALLSAGVPTGIEGYARYVRKLGRTDARSLVIGSRVAAIVGFTAAGPLFGCSIFAPVPLATAGGIVIVTVASLGIALSIRAIRESGREPVPTAGPTIVPFVAALEGGAAAGIAGSF